jgi:hypothetical protein
MEEKGNINIAIRKHLGYYKCLFVHVKQYEKYNEVYHDPKDKILKLHYHVAVAAL